MVSTSLGESDAKFPNQHGDGLPPSPTRENPGQVYPKSDPSPAPRTPATPATPLANPFLFRAVLDDLDTALGRAADAVRSEAPGGGLFDMIDGWRRDLAGVRARSSPGASRSQSAGREGLTERAGFSMGRIVEDMQTGHGTERGRGRERESRIGAGDADAESAESGGMFVD